MGWAGQASQLGKADRTGKLCQAVQASLKDKASRLGRPGRKVRRGNPGKRDRQGKHAAQAGKTCNVRR